MFTSFSNHSRLLQIKVDKEVSFCGGKKFELNGGEFKLHVALNFLEE